MSATSDGDKKRIAADCWRRGNAALPAENFDYAIEMYLTAVKLLPDSLVYRQSLRFTEYKKFKNNGSGASMAGMRAMGSRGRVKTARLSKDWATVDLAAEEGLQLNPWDVGFNIDVGDAARARGHGEVAVFAYQEALKREPGHKELN
ncbi:MAG: tetratricopeptide repeat protein, partial [Planctomycetaceae bacterium]